MADGGDGYELDPADFGPDVAPSPDDGAADVFAPSDLEDDAT